MIFDRRRLEGRGGVDGGRTMALAATPRSARLCCVETIDLRRWARRRFHGVGRCSELSPGAVRCADRSRLRCAPIRREAERREAGRLQGGRLKSEKSEGERLWRLPPAFQLQASSLPALQHSASSLNVYKLSVVPRGSCPRVHPTALSSQRPGIGDGNRERESGRSP